MTSPRLNAAFVLAALAVIIAVIWTNPYGRVALGGHGIVFGYFIWALLIGLCLTHVALFLIMWLQRNTWRPSEAGMFRFMAVKAMFWGTTAYFYRPHDVGVPVLNLVLFTLMFVVTAHMDVLMVGRYILGWEAQPQEWDGTERRGVARGRRWSDIRRGT